MQYPIWEIGIGGGMLMAIVAVSHVIVSHFAVGGGLLIAVTESLAVRRSDADLRDLAKRSSLLLILVSTVFGAISGVGIWVVAGLISPGAISALIHTYVWGWAMEWTFFVVEIVAALLYYATWDRVSKSVHLLIGWIYFVAAYLSLVVINGIITFMLTPGRWLQTGRFWDGFFNPTYWPGLVLRSGICAMMASAFLLLAAQRSRAEARPRLVRYLGWWLTGGALVSYAGYRFWEVSLPDPVLAIFRGASPLLPSLAATRSLTLWALAAALALGFLFLVALPRWGRLVPVVAVAATAFLFFGSYERLREGVRKPFLIHSHMFSNGLRLADVATVDASGLDTYTGWITVRAGTDGSPVRRGREIFSVQCASCHTIDGYQGIRRALPTLEDMLGVATEATSERVFAAECARCHRDDFTAQEVREMLPSVDEIHEDPSLVLELNGGMIAATLAELHDMGEFYSAVDTTRIVDPHATPHPAMPPLVGNQADVDALAAYLEALARGAGADGNTESGGG